MIIIWPYIVFCSGIYLVLVESVHILNPQNDLRGSLWGYGTNDGKQIIFIFSHPLLLFQALKPGFKNIQIVMVAYSLQSTWVLP